MTTTQPVKYHKGDRVTTSGQGRTLSWFGFMGTVTRATKRHVYVVWDALSFEDEMAIDEVKHLEESAS